MSGSTTYSNINKRPKNSTGIVTLDSAQEAQVLSYARSAQVMLNTMYPMRARMVEIDRAYMREDDRTQEQYRDKASNRLGNPKRFQNITVPVIMPQVRAALGYMTEVFLTGQPIFAVVSTPEFEDAAKQLEAIISENSITMGWARQLSMFFSDGLKYNLCALECYWDEQTIASVVSDISHPKGASVNSAIWQGNVVKRVDPYNMFFDPRVAPADLYRFGDFAGYTELWSKARLKKFLNNLGDSIDRNTLDRIMKAGLGIAGTILGDSPFGYYKPNINPSPLLNNSSGNIQTMDWMQWADSSLAKNPMENYKNSYTHTVLYSRIIPNDYGLNVPAPNTPQVWKFNIINGSIVITAERLSAAHDFIPILFGQPIEDGLEFQSKSFASNVLPMQDVASSMINAYVASRRRSIADRALYDPMRVSERDINSIDPAAKIPVRASAYGKPVSEAVYQFPYRDEQSAQQLQGVKVVTDMANIINGQNPAQQGQFVKGNKTLHEYDDIMGHGNVGNQMMAIAIESQVFTPLKEIIKLNILLHQQAAVMYSPTTQQQVKIDPTTLRTMSVQFKLSDGLVPADKLINGDEWMTALQVLGSSQQIGQGYNLAPMFSYLMKLRGADLTPFEKSPQQIQYEQQLAAWQQAAAQAAKEGATFSTPMPQAPPPPNPTPSANSVALTSTQGTQPTQGGQGSPGSQSMPTQGGQPGGPGGPGGPQPNQQGNQ